MNAERWAKAQAEAALYDALDVECQNAPAPNYAEDDYAAGYIAGLTFAQNLIGTPADRALAEGADQ